MSLPGFEPGLSRPRRDVLTTRRQGRPKRRWADCVHARERAVRELLTRTASAKDSMQPAVQLPRVRCDRPPNTMKPLVVSRGAALVTARCAVRPPPPPCDVILFPMRNYLALLNSFSLLLRLRHILPSSQRSPSSPSSPCAAPPHAQPLAQSLLAIFPVHPLPPCSGASFACNPSQAFTHLLPVRRVRPLLPVCRAMFKIKKSSAPISPCAARCF